MGFRMIGGRSEEESLSNPNMTLEEFEQILKEENIPRKWVSLNDGYEAPVTLSGDTLRYGKYGCTRFLSNVHYDFILEKLRQYKNEQDFIQSNETAQITDIMIVSSERVREYGDVFVVRRDSVKGENDEELLKRKFEYVGYDQYMGYYYYEKKCGDEIFTGVDIGLRIRTRDFEREQYGFKDVVMDSYVTLPLPIKLRSRIVEYIRRNKKQEISKKDNLFQDIINFFGFENIIEEENKRIKFYDEVCKNILGYEIEHQIFLGQYSEEKLAEAYHSIKMIDIFSNILTMSSRPGFIEESRVLEAKKILKELMEEQQKEVGIKPIPKNVEKVQISEEVQKLETEPIPEKPKMSKRAKEYPKLHKIYVELSRQDEMIFKAQRECSDMEKEMDNLKGLLKLKRNKLQNQIDYKNEIIDILKAELSGIVKRNGFKNLVAFYKTYNKSRSDYIYYQEQLAKWENKE